MMSTSNKKKYTLFAAAEGDGPRLCAFFASSAGCRNGDKCKFLHQKPDSAVVEKTAPNDGVKNVKDVRWAPSPVKSTSASPISSESSGDEDDVFASRSPKKGVKEIPQSDSKPVSTTIPLEVNTEPESSGKKKRKNRRGKSAVFAAPDIPASQSTMLAPTHAASNYPKTEPQEVSPPPAKKQRTPSTSTSKNATPQNNGGNMSFMSLNLPVAPFSCLKDGSGVTPVVKKETAKSQFNPATSKESNTTVATMQIPYPKSNADGRRWGSAIDASREHSRYGKMFDFDRFQEQDRDAGVTTPWVTTKPYGDWSATNPQAICIDCEMCETQDPVTGKKNNRALCRVSVIDVMNEGKVLLDTLVKPDWPVTDYRTWVNGISEKDLANVHFTLRHAQAFMLALCSDETVIMGHALQNDLAALQVIHYCNVDSTCLFAVKGDESNEASISLKDLAASVLDRVMPNTHDSVNDARTTMECIQHWMEKDGDVESILRTPNDRKSVWESYASKLFVHRIPARCRESHLSKMILDYTSVQPTEVEKIEFGTIVNGTAGTGFGKTHVVFRSARHANLAFDALDGKAEPDAGGRLQKKIFTVNGDFVRVRKMAYERQPKTDENASLNKRIENVEEALNEAFQGAHDDEPQLEIYSRNEKRRNVAERLVKTLL